MWYCSRAMLGVFALAYIVRSILSLFGIVAYTELQPGHAAALYDVIVVTRSATAGKRAYIHSSWQLIQS